MITSGFQTLFDHERCASWEELRTICMTINQVHNLRKIGNLLRSLKLVNYLIDSKITTGNNDATQMRENDRSKFNSTNLPY